MKKSVISVKSMIVTYIRYGLDDRTWEMFYNMRCHDLITYDDWMKFAETCSGFSFSEDARTIIDINKGDKVLYTLDEQGFWVKVK